MALIDSLRSFTTAVVNRSSADLIEQEIQNLFEELHNLAGVAVPTKQVTTTVTTVEVAPVTPPTP